MSADKVVPFPNADAPTFRAIATDLIYEAHRLAFGDYLQRAAEVSPDSDLGLAICVWTEAVSAHAESTEQRAGKR